jgi:hypothetical protein
MSASAAVLSPAAPSAASVLAALRRVSPEAEGLPALAEGISAALAADPLRPYTVIGWGGGGDAPWRPLWWVPAADRGEAGRLRFHLAAGAAEAVTLSRFP